jgi:phenylpyruvate tautomerase PptA (4-oxalocrotonate tautomerase family)
VFTAQNYRLVRQEYRRLEAELTPLQLKKVNLVNMAYIYRKLNALLVELNERPFGFPEFTIPEESWLTKVARFVDRKNVMEFFQSSIEPNGIPRNTSERIHSARTNAHQFVFGDGQLLDNQKVYLAVKEISECYRRIISKRIEIQETEHTLAQQRLKLAEEDTALKSSLLKSSTTIVAIAANDFNPDELYIEGNQTGQANRLQLLQINKILRFVYCTDSVLDRDQEVLRLTNEYAVRNN